MFDPAGLSRKGARDASDKIRQKMFREGKKIERKLMKAIHDLESNDDDEKLQEMLIAVSVYLGEASAYCNIRRAIAPDVPSDQLTKQLEGRVRSMQRKLNLD